MKFAQQYGPWALVTGASSGIGEQFARELARRGLHVVLVARRAERLQAVAAEIERAHGVRTQVLTHDLAVPGATGALRDQLAEHDLGMVVHAAGVGRSGPHLSHDLDEHRKMLELNCGSVLEMTHAFVPALKERGRGAFVLLGSVIGYTGVPWSSHYAATKAFVLSLGEGLQVELADTGVDVVVSAPGPTRTGFFEAADMQAGMAVAPLTVVRGTLSRLHTRRIVLPDWMARLIRAAMSTAPRWIGVRIMARIMGSMARHAP